ncbi:MAG: hypothetical protein IH995_07495 [Proteobacteria bacterium]|nr:hypothetical protein [Pseudomonadota bacterium]
MSLMELFNLAILIALIYFSAWSFYLKFKANRVTTTKDLLLAFVTGGTLAVATMVFGVTGEIIDASASIKQDTVSIRSTLEGGTRPEAADSAFERVGTADPQINPGNDQLVELIKINQQQTQVLRRLLGQTEGLIEKVDLTNQLIERILTASGSDQQIPTNFSGSQFTIQLDLVCSLPRTSVVLLPASCVIRPSEG